MNKIPFVNLVSAGKQLYCNFSFDSPTDLYKSRNYYYRGYLEHVFQPSALSKDARYLTYQQMLA